MPPKNKWRNCIDSAIKLLHKKQESKLYKYEFDFLFFTVVLQFIS